MMTASSNHRFREAKSLIASVLCSLAALLVIAPLGLIWAQKRSDGGLGNQRLWLILAFGELIELRQQSGIDIN